ncbi:MAG: dTDP-glucose 4,6-dehydratase [Candidatus Altiarchaeales archaeon ex4484_96]|nr:MAG: dTDP-glucose 4,6-dehydratase [Candidatus Altiarchaeales archaeon ex4484_96]
MKHIKIILLAIISLLLAGCTTQPDKTTTTTKQPTYCDAITPCETGECIKFPDNAKPICYTGDPCARCPSKKCVMLESYPPQVRCLDEQTNQTFTTPKIDLSNTQTEGLSFLKHYQAKSLEIQLKTAQYQLPLTLKQTANHEQFTMKIALEQERKNLLEANGFVVIQNPLNSQKEDMVEVYDALKNQEIPVYVTSDSLLHLYHIQFDETLRQIEEAEFYDNIYNISKELLSISQNGYGKLAVLCRTLTPQEQELSDAYKRNIIYLSVALKLLEPTEDQLCNLGEWQCQDSGIKNAFFTEEELHKYSFTVPSIVEDEVQAELALIDAHEGFNPSPLYIYCEDYSQYKPRGHYTRSEKLKNYFKAMMWYGRMSMLLKGTDQVPPGEACNDIPSCTALISTYDARIQSMQAALLSAYFAEDPELMDKWDRIYTVTAFYVGLSDDLGPYEYINALNHVFGETLETDELTPDKIGNLKAKLAEYQTPKIYGGTGEVALWPPFSVEQADRMLAVTQGFRLMGQRFIPDSYMMSELVSPRVGFYAGDDEPFTMCMTDAGPARCFPRGLDVMALLGSKRAETLLDELGDTQYEEANKSYIKQYDRLEAEFNNFTIEDWNRNLYWSWLYALKSLVKNYSDGYPTYMQSSAWEDKQLTCALASWTELRHDTILYAKQSYTPSLRSMQPVEKQVVGYVEPVPELYNRLLSLTQMTTSGLTEMNVLDESSKNRLMNLETILGRLINISEKELENRELTQEDYDFIKDFGENLEGVISEVDDKAKKTTIVADVHTDQNTGLVLEEGVGYVELIVVAYRVPDGRIILGAGPVFSYYEFKHPMSDRLTDEDWRDLLGSSSPDKPKWYASYAT